LSRREAPAATAAAAVALLLFFSCFETKASARNSSSGWRPEDDVRTAAARRAAERSRPHAAIRLLLDVDDDRESEEVFIAKAMVFFSGRAERGGIESLAKAEAAVAAN
jgi:hypothetical protein